MQFSERPVTQSLGWSLAHSLKIGATKLSKGLTLTEEYIAQLAAASVETVYVYRLDADDVAEDEAATRIAGHIMGPGLTLGIATHGRCNLHATTDGLLLAPASLGALNAADEAITLATLPHMSPVAKGQLIATVKIIPYGIAEEKLSDAMVAETKLNIAPFQTFQADLIVTGQSLPEKVRKLTEQRLSALQGTIDNHISCPHTMKALIGTFRHATTTPSQLILVLGVSAISDRRDVIPAALEAAGGEVISLGMPVDPGNLLMLGRLGNKTVIGLPGCARSPALNGLDWILERFAARLPLDRDVIADMGIGGLLKETPFRPEPRAPRSQASRPSAMPLILAAGRSTRSGKTNKLLNRMNGHTVIRQTVAAIESAKMGEPVLVLGHQADDVAAALSGLRCKTVINPDFATGMASSLKLGLAHLPPETDFACICLGDMPFVRPETPKALLDAAARLSEFKIFIPTFNGKRGHPVLWQRDMVPALMATEGDKGGRQVIFEHEDLICEVAVDDHGILIDLDTPEALAQFGATPD